ncbi:MAG: type II secretion system F family protein [Actinomycetota bacterium]
MPVLAAALAAFCAVLLVGAVARAQGNRPKLPAAPVGPPSPSRRLPARHLSAAVLAGMCLLAPPPVPLLAPVVGLVAWRAPVFVAGRASRRRRARVDAELPQLLDLLAAASSAGLSASLSLRRAAGALEGPLAEELGSVFRAVDLGGRWREELGVTAERLALPDLRRTVTALTRTETLGSSLATSMQELAERVRASRRAAVTERARTAPVKMLFPLVFLVLPAFLLLTVVPVLLSTLQSIR